MNGPNPFRKEGSPRNGPLGLSESDTRKLALGYLSTDTVLAIKVYTALFDSCREYVEQFNAEDKYYKKEK